MTVKTGMCLSNHYHMCPKDQLTPRGCICSCHNSNKPVPDPQEVVDLYVAADKAHLVILPEEAEAPVLVLRKRKPNAPRKKVQS